MNFSPAEQQVYRLLPGDILLNEGQSPELVGRPAMYDGTPPNIFFQNHLIRFRARDSVSPHFALLVFRYYFRTGRFTATARWSTNIANLGLQRFSALPFPLPPREQQDRIVKEARRSLEASEALRSTAELSLKRLGEVRHELLVVAVSGRLVPQSPDDEPASALVERLGPPKEAVATIAEASTQGLNMARTTSRLSPRRCLRNVLQERGGRATAEELFGGAGYSRDSTEDVEAFYLALRALLGKTVQTVPMPDGSVVLEATPDAP